MDHSACRFDPVLIRSIVAAFEAVINQLAPRADNPAFRSTIARRIVDAASAGERDHLKLEMAGHFQMTIEQQLPAAHRCSS